MLAPGDTSCRFRLLQRGAGLSKVPKGFAGSSPPFLPSPASSPVLSLPLSSSSWFCLSSFPYHLKREELSIYLGCAFFQNRWKGNGLPWSLGVWPVNKPSVIPVPFAVINQGLALWSSERKTLIHSAISHHLIYFFSMAITVESKFVAEA